MSGGTLQERAERILAQAFPEGFASDGRRVEVLSQDGTLLLFARSPKEDDPLSMLMENAKPGKALPAHFVIDPETGRPTRRYAIPYRTWARPETLRASLDGGDPQASFPSTSSLHMWKQVPEGAAVHRYGRGSRFTLILDREPAVLAARIFPAGLWMSCGSTLTPARLARMAIILLARSDARLGPILSICCGGKISPA